MTAQGQPHYIPQSENDQYLWQKCLFITFPLLLQKGPNLHMGEFVVEGFFFLEVVTFFVTLRADLEDYFKCKT